MKVVGFILWPVARILRLKCSGVKAENPYLTLYNRAKNPKHSVGPQNHQNQQETKHITTDKQPGEKTMYLLVGQILAPQTNGCPKQSDEVFMR